MSKRKENKVTKQGLSIIKKYSSQLLIGVGIFLIGVSSLHNYLRDRALAMDKQVVSEYIQEAKAQNASTSGQPQRNFPTHLSVGTFVDTDIEEEVLDGKKWTISPDKASHLLQSAVPGEQGNIIIYGHNKPEILGNIRAFTGKETITIRTSDGVDHRYRITQMEEVEPTDMKALQPTKKEMLTVYTCSGLLDSKRFVVRGEPLKS